MKKRIISLILALALCVGMLPAPAWAEEPTDPTQAVEVVGAANPSEETDPTTEPTEEETEPTEAPTEAPAAEPTPAPTEALAPETTVAPAPTEAPTEPAPTEDEAVAAVQAMIDALPDVEDMSESYLDALVAAYSAFDALSEAQQAQINGVEKLEALFNWVNSQVSTLAAEETISGEVNWNNRTLTTPVKLTGDTTLTLTGTNRIECEKPLDLNGHKLTIQGTGSLELVGSNNDGNYYNSGTIYDSTWTGTSYTGGGMVIESGTVIARADVYNAVAVRYLYMEGGKLEAYGARAGIVTTDLQIKDGSLYATGNSKCGINMYSAPRAVSVNGLNILVSNEPNAQEADMEDGTTEQIENSEPKKTVAIGKFSTSPSISVQPQQGYLYEATAKTATFALSGRNVDLSALNLEWTGSHTGLEASADGKTVTVTTDKTVQAGTYGLKVSAGGASRTAVVTVSGPPICIYDRPVDTISTDPEAGAVTVTAYLTDGRTGSIDFQWKREDGTVICTGETVLLYDLVEQGMLTQDASKPWLQTIRIYCTLSYDGYSLNTDTVTVGLNSCSHPGVDHEGNCLQCGQKKGDGDALLVREDGLYHLIANAEPGEANVGLFMYGGGNFYLTGDVPNKIVNVSDTNVGGKNVTLDLQGHTVKSLQMGNFPYGTFTVKNGTLKDLDTAASGKLILENILYQGKWFDEEFDLTVQGENTRFERQVTFWGTTHLKGGRFSQGLDSACADRALELLEEGFAFYDDNGKVVDATDSTKLVGREIRVASHTCDYTGDYRYGKCDCGRSCDHQGTTDENGYCTNCGTFVYPFAIGEKLYTGLEAALTAAQEGDTVTLRGDYDMQGAAVEITKSITLELNGHTLSSWPYEPILTILAPDVTIQNGTVKNTDTSKSAPAVQVGALHTKEATLTVKDAIFEGSESHGNPRNYGLSIFAGNTAQAENGTFTGGIYVSGSLTLSGGKADRIYVGTGVTYASLLAKGYAYQAKGQLVKPENMADGIAVEVVKCGHPDGLTDTEACAYCGLTCNHPGIDSTTGNCTVCGLFQATASVAAGGTTTYFPNFSVALEAAKAASGSTLTLFQDVALTGENSIYIDSGTFTIDWNGHTLSGEMSNVLLCITDAAKVTLTDSVGTGGVHNADGAAIGAYVGSQGSLTIRGGVYSPQLWKDRTAYGPIQISGGRFENPEDSGRNGALYCYSGALAELLAPGYTFAYEEDDSLVDVYQRKSDIYRTVYVVEHQHEFEEGQCPCGYLCPHDEVDEEGVCTLCGKRFYVRGTYADGTTHYYGTISDALGDSAVTQATILRALTEECESWNGGGRSVTLDLNGWNLVVESIQGGHLILRDSSGIGSILGMAEILKDGQVSVESGRLAPQGETLSVSGKLTVTGGKVDSLTAMKGSTVSLSGGYVGSLTAMEGSTVSLSGGSFGKIVGSGVTLKELLAEDRYYAELDGTPKNYADTDTVLEQVSVELCDHTSVREIDIGYGRKQYKCNCGQVTYLLTVTVGESDKKYFGDYNTGFAYAAKSDGVVRFLELNGTIEVNAQGMVTIDMENRSYSAYDRSLVIKSGSTVQLVGQGWQSSAPEAGSGSSSSGKLEYSEFIPVTVESGGTFVLPANNLNGEPNMAKPTQLTVQSGGTAELQGGSTQWTDVYGTLKISGGSHWYIHQYEMGQLNITGGQIQLLQIYGDLPQNALSGGSYVTISVMEFRSGETEKFRDVTFADFQKMLVSGKVFQKKQDQSYPNEVEETPNYGTFNYSKELKNVNVTAAPFTGVQVVCQLGNTEHSGSVTTVYGGQEEDFFLKARLLSPAAEDQSVTYQWYQVQDGSKTEVGKDETYQLKQPINVGVYTYQVTASCNGYELTSDPFTVTVGKAPQTADVEAHDETVSGKNDGYVTLKPLLSAYEMRKQGEETFTACEGAGTKLPLPAGTYEIRMKETKNYNPTPAETVTIGAGPKLTVTLPSPQTGYSLTADKQELGWHDSVTLTLTLETGYYPTASLAIKAGDRVFTEDKGTYTLTNVEENLTITLEGVEKDEKAPSLALRNWIFGRGAFQGMASCKEWKNISTATAPYYIISTRGNYFAVEASDGETGLASASYLLSRTALTREALEQAAWEPVPEESLNLASPDRKKMIQLGLGEWYFYVKAVDKAGNVSYVGSDKLIREDNAPRFGGVINGATYYTTQKVTITDDYALSRYLAPESQNWKNISGTSYEVTLEGNREGTYTMEAEDACQNTSTLTVYMKPISSLTEDIRDLTEDNVCKSDLDQLTQAEKALKALDTTNATAEEKEIITEALDNIGKLKTVLEEVTRVEAKIAALPDSVEPYQQTVEDTQIKPARQAYSDLTDHQKTLVDSTKLDKLVRLEAQLNAWTITEGDGQTWYKGSWNPLSFTVNGQTRKFSKVLLDGKMHITATPSFLAVSGSIDEPFTLTLKPEFLQVSMEPGEHTLTVIYGENNSGTGTVTFTVEIPANYLDVTGKPEFDGKTTVTVDGKEYPIEEMNGTRYVNLPETGDLLTIYSFKDGTPTGSCTNYPIGMQVFRITRQEGGAKAEEITEFANLLNYAGCSIRLTGTKGIRMITGIGENARTALTGARGLGGYTLEEYGTVVMRGVGTPTLENSKSHNFAYKKGKADPIFSRANGMIQYTNVLVGFGLEDCKDTLTLRPYIKLKDMTTGETVTLYGGCVSRSIGYIAKQNENTYKPGTAGYKYIHEIIDAVYGKTEQGGETK